MNAEARSNAGTIALITVTAFSTFLFLGLALFAEVSPTWRVIDVLLSVGYGVTTVALVAGRPRRDR